VIDWLVKVLSNFKRGERGGEVVNRMIESISECEGTQKRRQMVGWVVEHIVIYEVEVCERGWEVVDRMVEDIRKMEGGEGRGEVVDWLIKTG
jgi:hypothetical protein